MIRLQVIQSGVRFPSRKRFLFLSNFLSMSLGPKWPPIQNTSWIFGAIKRPGRDVDHLPPTRAEIKKEWSYTSTPSIHLHGQTKLYLFYVTRPR